jgi:cytosol alanyl aminopeptidase
LELAEAFHADPSRYVEESALGIVLSLRAHLIDEKLTPNYQRFIRKNFGEQAHALGWTPKAGESDETRLLRPRLLEAVSTDGGDRELAKQAAEMSDQWMKDHNSIDANLVDSVIQTTAYWGDKSLFDRFLGEFKKTTDRQVRSQLIGAMSSFRDPAAINAAMQAVVKGDIPFLEGAGPLFGGQGDPATRKMAFEFLKAHYDEITAKMPTGGGFDFGTVLPQVGASYCDAQSKADMQSFFAPRIGKFVGGQRALDQVLESIDLCASRVEGQKADVAAFLAKY